MTKGRLEAFSDGIIAIIITITILLIDLPEGNEWADLMAIMPLIGCYLISFILVGTNWVQSSSLASGHPGSQRESAVGQSADSFSSVFRSRFPPDGLENLALP